MPRLADPQPRAEAIANAGLSGIPARRLAVAAASSREPRGRAWERRFLPPGLRSAAPRCAPEGLPRCARSSFWSSLACGSLRATCGHLLFGFHRQRGEEARDRSASRSEMPGTAASSATGASRTARSEPSSRSSARRLPGPMPGISSRIEVSPTSQRSVALELDREAVRLVAHALEQQQRRASSAAAAPGPCGPGRKTRSALSPPERFTRGEGLSSSRSFASDAWSTRERRASASAALATASWPLAAVDQQQVGQRLALDPREPAARSPRAGRRSRRRPPPRGSGSGGSRPCTAAVLEHHAARRRASVPCSVETS